jgi:tRNA G46 methylase TrmB
MKVIYQLRLHFKSANPNIFNSFNLVPDNLKITKNSSFIDIGSGFGKCVLHTRIQIGAKNCLGIEYVKTRNDKALEVLEFLRY